MIRYMIEFLIIGMSTGNAIYAFNQGSDRAFICAYIGLIGWLVIRAVREDQP